MTKNRTDSHHFEVDRTILELSHSDESFWDLDKICTYSDLESGLGLSLHF